MDNRKISPFIGVRPFTTSEDDRLRFSGRFFETQRIISYIYSHPVTLIYAPSGAGKTSLINAAVIPGIKKKKFEVFPATRVQNIVSSKNAPVVKNQYIFNMLFRMSEDVDEVANETLASYLKKQPVKYDDTDRELPKLIVIDQFEEIFNVPVENWRQQQNEFFIQIGQAIKDNPLLRIVFLIREEYVGQLEAFGKYLPEEFRIRFRLGPLSTKDAIAALCKPLECTSRCFSEGVAEKIVNDMSKVKWTNDKNEIKEVQGSSIEPVHLQLVGATLWNNLPDGVAAIEMQHVKQYGDVDTILQDYYEKIIGGIAGFKLMKQKALRHWFGTRLITPVGTRSIVFRDAKTTHGLDNAIIDKLSDQHIIRGEDRSGGRWYELTHDRWIQPIKTSNAVWNRRRAKAVQKKIVTGLVSVMLIGTLFTAYKYQTLNLNPSIVPMPDVGKYEQIDKLLPPSYKRFNVLRDIRVFDFRSRKKLPFWQGKLDGRYSPVTLIRYTLANKLDSNAHTLTFNLATSGYLSPRSLTHDYKLLFCPNCTLHSGKKTREAWHVNTNVEREAVGENFLVVTEATFWNAFQGDEDNHEWASIDVVEKNTAMIGVALIFSSDATYKQLKVYKHNKEQNKKELLILPTNGEMTKDENGTTIYKLFLDDKSRTIFWFINNPDIDFRYDVEWTWVDKS